jgi:hypothetical protein
MLTSIVGALRTGGTLNDSNDGRQAFRLRHDASEKAGSTALSPVECLGGGGVIVQVYASEGLKRESIRRERFPRKSAERQYRKQSFTLTRSARRFLSRRQSRQLIRPRQFYKGWKPSLTPVTCS